MSREGNTSPLTSLTPEIGYWTRYGRKDINPQPCRLDVLEDSQDSATL